MYSILFISAPLSFAVLWIVTEFQRRAERRKFKAAEDRQLKTIAGLIKYSNRLTVQAVKRRIMEESGTVACPDCGTVHGVVAPIFRCQACDSFGIPVTSHIRPMTADEKSDPAVRAKVGRLLEGWE